MLRYHGGAVPKDRVAATQIATMVLLHLLWTAYWVRHAVGHALCVCAAGYMEANYQSRCTWKQVLHTYLPFL